VIDEATERELLELLDRDRVVALMNRYFGSIDNGVSLDAEWARSIFSDDVRIEHRGIVLSGVDDVAVGHAFVRDGWDRTVHLATNPRVVVDGDDARLSGRLLALHLHRDATPPEPYVIANTFEADAVRTSDGWRFRSISQDTVWSGGRSHIDLAGGER
jgi:hypothetical protein